MKPYKYIPLLILPITLFLFCRMGEGIPHKRPKNMAYVPEGYFVMGADSTRFDDEKPSHYVFIDPFYIDIFEVSNDEYLKFVRATGRKPPKFIKDERFNHPESPVVGVTWHDAAAYAEWAGKRLPTEAEWEKAARGVDQREWPWGNNWEPSLRYYMLNILGKADNFEFTAPVNYFKDGASPYGAYNMAGNVWEWCSDWYDKNYYSHSPELNPPGPASGERKALKGGSWTNKIENVRAARRIRNYPDVELEIYGFRCAMDAM